VIAGVLDDIGIRERFRLSQPLPDQYGIAIDERCVEYPWALANLPADGATVLDAGSALNHDYILDAAPLPTKRIAILTLAPEHACFWSRGISYLFSDLRDIPLRDGLFDAVTCLSTLEHVDFDNAYYTKGVPQSFQASGDYRAVVGELNRVLKVNGTLLFTVPFGQRRNFGEFQQFDRALLDEAIAAFGQAHERVVTFYRYSSTGWQLADAASCAQCEYVEWITRPRSEWPETVPVEPDLAAAARAVACVRLVKA
jgi:SAM-dependent methyltransferase